MSEFLILTIISSFFEDNDKDCKNNIKNKTKNKNKVKKLNFIDTKYNNNFNKNKNFLRLQ